MFVKVPLERTGMKREEENISEDDNTYQAILNLVVPILVNVLALLLFWYAMNH